MDLNPTHFFSAAGRVQLTQPSPSSVEQPYAPKNNVHAWTGATAIIRSSAKAYKGVNAQNKLGADRNPKYLKHQSLSHVGNYFSWLTTIVVISYQNDEKSYNTIETSARLLRAACCWARCWGPSPPRSAPDRTTTSSD